jgi:hypothetical protein
MLTVCSRLLFSNIASVFPFRVLLKLPKFSELRDIERSVERGFAYIASDIQWAGVVRGDRDG